MTLADAYTPYVISKETSDALTRRFPRPDNCGAENVQRGLCLALKSENNVGHLM